MTSFRKPIAITDNMSFSLINFGDPLIGDIVVRGHRVVALAPDFDAPTRATVRALVTDVRSAALIVGEAGWSVHPNDSQALAGATEQALRERENVEKRPVRQSAARQRIVNKFSLKIMMVRHEEARVFEHY